MKRKIYAVLLGLSLPFLAVAGLETGTYISDLVTTNPTGSDNYATADDHLRLLKTTIKNTFPNINNAVTKTDEQLNDVAQLSQQNTFTGTQTISLSTGGLLELDDTDAAANERRWRLLSDTGQFCVYTATDAGVGTSNAICADRTGTTVDSVTLFGAINSANTTFTVDGSNPKLALRSGGGTTQARFEVSAGDTYLISDVNNASLNINTTGTGGTIFLGNSTGALAWRDVGGLLRIRGTANNQTTNNSYISLQQLGATENGWVGFGNNTSTLSITNNINAGNVDLNTSGAGLVRANGQNIRDTALFTSGTLPVARGGTGTTTSTGTGSVVLSASPTLTGTTTAATLNATTLQQNSIQVQSAAFMRAAHGRFNGTTGALIAGSGITSGSRVGAGQYTIDLTAAGFSATPTCVATTNTASNTATALPSSNVAYSVNTRVPSTLAAQDSDYQLLCLGN
jgi:hypothetical protein